MKRPYFIYIVPLLLLLVAGCRKTDNLDVRPPVDLGGEITELTSIDQWLLDSLTTPYNIAVKYRWDQWELNLDRTLTPPDESKILPAMSAIKRVWIDPYNAETGNDMFIKTYSPKQFKLIGSVQYNYNGTVVLGQAEGGNNIAFFDINQNFDKDPVSSIKRMIQTSHHEFAHILHQNVLYPPDFRGLSARNGRASYTATWFNVSAEEALANGYITPYSMASADEDFVEMIANMLMEGRTRFNQLVATTDSITQQIFRRKEQFVVEYFKNVYNMDFYSLQTKVQAALYNLAPVPAIENAFGFNREYSVVSVDPTQTTLLPLPAAFRSIFTAAQNNVAAIPNTNLRLDSFLVAAVDPSVAVLAMFVTNGNQRGLAQFQLSANQSGSNYSYSYIGADANGAFIKDAVQPLIDYFTTSPFAVTWYVRPDVSIYPRARFTPQHATGSFFYGFLQP